jgi:hypothetical protein
MVNNTIPDLLLLGKKSVNAENVSNIQVIRQRGGTRVLVFDSASQNMTVENINLQKSDKPIHFPAGPDGSEVQDIVAQPLSLLLLHKDSIDFFKLSSNQLQFRNGSCSAPEGVEFS